MLSPKKLLKFAFIVLLVLYIFRSCSYAWTYEDFLEFSNQTSTSVPDGQLNKDSSRFYLLRQTQIENAITSRGYDVDNYNNFISRVSSTTSSGTRYYYYYYYFFNYLDNGSISISNSVCNIANTNGIYLEYRVRQGYNGSYELWSAGLTTQNLASIGYNKQGYYGLQTLPVDNYYGWRLENDYVEPIRVNFIANGDELSYYTNGLKVNNLTVYYDFNQWVNLGTIINGEDFTFVGSLARISNPSTDYHLYETFNYPENLYITDNMYVDINSYNLNSGQFYSLALGVYKDNEYVTEFNVYYYINGGPSSGDWLIVRSGDSEAGPDAQTNTKNIIDSINDGFTSLFTIDSGDVDEIYNNALTYFPSGDSPVALYDIIFGSLDGNSSGDFIISWDNFNLIATISGGNVFYSGDFIAGNSINFSKFCRENEQFFILKGYINSFTQFFFILGFLLVFYKCIMVMLGVSTDFINEELSPESDDYKRHEIGFIQGGRK